MSSKKERIEEIKGDLRKWHSEGYYLDPIFKSLKDRDVKKFVELYKKYKKIIPEMKRYEELLKDYEDPQAVRYKKILKNPEEFENNQEEIDDYVRKKKNIEESEDEIFDLLAGVRSEDVGSGLNPGLTFDNYVVHDGNELAYTAANKIVESPGSINPLIIYGESGTGKTHLLNAIGNKYLGKNVRVLYKNSEEIILSKNSSFDADVLLIDDFHLLLERDELHPLINLIVENFSKEGKQLVMASNFKVDYYAVEPSLRAKLESGISVKLANPSEEIRLKILKIKTAEMNVNLDEEVILYLTKNMSNLSRLVSTIKKIVAFSKILGEKPSISMAADIIKSRVSLQPGVSYLVEEEKPYRSISYFKETIERGYDGIVITRINPNRFGQLYNIRKNIYWLTDHPTSLNSVPPVLENINYFLEGYLDGKRVIYMDGIDFLMSKNTPDSVIQFIRHMVDAISETKVIFLISINPKTLEERYVKMMERELEIA